jgi:hypothetical protein
MACLPGYGEWILAKPKLIWRSDPPFVSLNVDFDRKQGTAEVGSGIGRPPTTSPLTNIVIISTTKFSADYTFGANKGTLVAEIDDHSRLDVSFTGTVTTSCMGEPLKIKPPGRLVDALRGLERDAQAFANSAIFDATVKSQYNSNIKKFDQNILAEVKKGKLTPDDAVKWVSVIRNAIAGVLGSRWVSAVKTAAKSAGETAPAWWGHHGTVKIQEAFGNPTLTDETWVQFARSASLARIKEKGVTTTSKSSWARWGEVKTFTYGELVWKIGPMSVYAESDLGIMSVAPKGAPIKEVKGLYGFKVEGEATVTVKVEVIESSTLKAMSAVEKSTGVALADLEDAYAIKMFEKALKDRAPPPGAGPRVFDRLSKGEQNQVRLEIVESSTPVEAKLPASAGKWGKIGKCLMIAGVTISIYNVAVADDKLKQASREVVGFGGGMMAGAATGATVSELAPTAAPIIIALSALLGGILGALGADYVFEWAEQLIQGEDEWWREYNK